MSDSPTQVTVNFNPDVVGVLENVFTEHIEDRIKKFAWSDNYYNSRNERKFSIIFQAGRELVLRAAVSTTVAIFVHGVNVIPGGQVKLTDPSVANAVINLLEKLAKHLRRSDLILRRDLVKYNAETRRFKQTVFNYEIPPDDLWVIPADEAEVVEFNYSVTMTVMDKLTKKTVTITGTNEAEGLLSLRARSKLYTMREFEYGE